MATFIFGNNAGLTIEDNAVVSQTIDVYGPTGPISNVSVSLSGLSHAFSDDLDMLLVGAVGGNLAFWTDVGGASNLNLLFVTISDSGSTALPDDSAPVTGTTYRPAGYGEVEDDSDFGLSGTTILHPATNGAVTFAEAFEGFVAFGTWTLIVADDAAEDTGTLLGWGLVIETDSSTASIGGSSGDDTLAVIFNSVTGNRYSLNGVASTVFSGVSSFEFAGAGGSDTFRITDEAGGTQFYSLGGNTISGSSIPTVTYTGDVVVNLTTGSGADTFTFTAATTGVINIDAGAGADRITILHSGAQDFSASTITGVETLQFGDLFAPITVTFLGTQFGAGKITAVNGDSATDNLIVNAASDVDLSGVTISNWTAGTDTITINGTAAGEKLTGSSQIDTINGNGGADTLDGRAGRDTMKGGDGSDTYFADVSNEIITETNASLATGGDDLVNYSGATGTFVLSANVERLTLTHASANTGGTGNGLANTIKGNAGANHLSGLGGNDTLEGNGGDDKLDGGTGADTMKGGTQNDTYIVDNAGDKVVESAGQGTDLVEASVSFTLGANVENLTLTGSAAINGTGNGLANAIIGNAAANSLIGLAGNDTVDGGGGDDRVNGGDGNDDLTGGAGKDTFVFNSAIKPKTAAKANADTVLDFSHADDTIELAKAVFSKLKAGALHKSDFGKGQVKPAKDKHALYYDKKDGTLWYDANGHKQGGKGDVLVATLDPHLHLAAHDIIVA